MQDVATLVEGISNLEDSLQHFNCTQPSYASSCTERFLHRVGLQYWFLQRSVYGLDISRTRMYRAQAIAVHEMMPAGGGTCLLQDVHERNVRGADSLC